MIKRIAFIGVAGCGKSVIAAETFVALKKQGKNVELITEWVRSDIHLKGPLTNIFEQFRTLINQKELEDAVPKNVEYVITDSGTLTPFFYSGVYADNTDPRQRLVMQDMFKILLDHIYLRRYSHVFYLPAYKDLPIPVDIINDGTRFQTQEQLDLIEEYMELIFTKIHKVDNIFVLDGPLDNRLEKVLGIIN